MSSSPADSRKRRTGLFSLNTRSPSPLAAVTNRHASSSPNASSSKLVKKKSRFADPLPSPKDALSLDESQPPAYSPDIEAYRQSSDPSVSRSGSPKASGNRPSLAKMASRPASIFGSLKNFRHADGIDTLPLSATSSNASTKSPHAQTAEFSAREETSSLGRSRHVIHHGEVQISSKWLMNKKEYLVLTDTHLVRFKNALKAAETFPFIPIHTHRTGMGARHSSTPSIDAAHDTHSFGSDSSEERDFGIPLNQIVAVQMPDESRPQTSLEVVYLEHESCHGVFLSFTFVHPNERDHWLQLLRDAANQIRLVSPEPVPLALVEYAARVVERAEDYSQNAFRIYKVVKRTTPRGGRVSADDSIKVSPFVCLLVIGVHKLHLIQLPKSSLRGSTPSLADLGEGYSHGILAVTLISVSGQDDNFALGFRSPFQRPRSYQLASLAATEIALALRTRDRALRPEWTNSPFLYNGPSPVDDELRRDDNDGTIPEFGNWAETLTAFCVAYGVNPSIVMYSVDYEVEDGPRLIFFPPSVARRGFYTAPELLAILRSLRYNESFGTLDFSNISLDEINEVYDDNGDEYICEYQKTGAPIGIPFEEQARASLLVTEIRALAATNRRLRRLDFSGSINQHLSDPTPKMRIPLGSGVFEALYPICCKQSTNVDWICVNGIPLQERDLEYLISLIAQRPCHVRGLELGGCSLTDHSFHLILDTLRMQANTVESLVLGSNSNRVMPLPLSRSLDSFDFVRKIDLSHLAVTSGDEPLLGFDTLKRWRLEELKLSGTTLNDDSIEDLCAYLGHKQSQVLKTLELASCSLSGSRVADLMEAMTRDSKVRSLFLDVSDNPLAMHGHDRLVGAIARNLAPSHLAMNQYEYDEDEHFAELLFALASNRSIRSLHFARVALPGVATDTSILALEELFCENNTLQELDISGEESRLEATRFGPGIVKALTGLKSNKTLLTLRVEYQKLGLHGSAALSEVIRSNVTLRELHCEHNDISMSGFVDICNAVQVNKTLLYLPSFEEGRETQLRHLQDQIREARTRTDGTPIGPAGKAANMRRSFAKFGHLDLPGSYAGSRKTPPVPQWTQQDEQHAYRMIAEGWEEHIARLNLYLERNRRLANGEPVDESEWDETRRPSTAGSLSKVLETATIQSTPRAEKHFDLDERSISPRNMTQPTERSPPPKEKLRVEIPEAAPKQSSRNFPRGSVPSEALTGLSSASPPPKLSRSISSSPTSPRSVASPFGSLPIFEGERSPVRGKPNPKWRPVTGDSGINVSPEVSPPALESAIEFAAADSSPELKMKSTSGRPRRPSSKSVGKKPSVRQGQYNHSAAPSPPPKD